MQTAYPLVSESLANKLAEAGLRGLTIVPAKMDYANTGRTIRDQVYLLSGPEPLPTVTRRVSPNIDNRCPVCSFSPVFCSACGFVSNPRPQCRSKLIQYGAANSTGHRQFKLSEVFPPELNRAAGAIDLARCAEGLDFSGILDSSRRAMEFLLSVNVYPMEILPLRTRFENGRVGLTREDAE
ncbi:hypothetical protein [Lacipirellula limnantheis]|uniref:Uncharacterized protein n=1 Tax=Lacipirellula limnantheis TaxID=2528024 RepID=A0A517U4D0_9BACT|nr:hypothetical protein [Lacipirellula limnantheis]QDT75484.1 hypothetical protein I41_46950 [Lacipirellula limnantheis]